MELVENSIHHDHHYHHDVIRGVECTGGVGPSHLNVIGSCRNQLSVGDTVANRHIRDHRLGIFLIGIKQQLMGCIYQHSGSLLMVTIDGDE